MTPQEAKKLMSLHQQGLRIHIFSRCVDRIYEEDGDIVYDSEVFSGRSLLTVDSDLVSVWAEVKNWMDVQPEALKKSR